MLFSEVFSVTRSNGDDWFDAILDVDTRLFIDPFLIYNTRNALFANAHAKLIEFFSKAFELAAESEETRENIKYRTLCKMMVFPEVKEICLGYASTTDGAGSGDGYSKDVVGAIYESIRMGFKSTSHFEDLGLFGPGIGRDRISDAAANLLKKELVEYTQDVCRRHGIPVEPFPLGYFGYDIANNRWSREQVELPRNPFFKDRCIILVPMSFLNDLPTLDAEEFFDFCWANKDEILRDEFSIRIKSDVDKKKIIEIAKQRRDWVLEYEHLRETTRQPVAYNLDRDPLGLYQWYKVSQAFGKQHPIDFPDIEEQNFERNLDIMIRQFVDYVENNSGYKLLWNDRGTSKSEEACQLLFTGIIKHYCKANNIDLSREVNLGRGPVDFKFSIGYEKRALLEVKLAKNSKFWNGLNKQLIKYMEVEHIIIGYFLVVCYNKKDLDKISDIETKTEDLAKSLGYSITSIVIDATDSKPSASKL
jgi:hypothetical protein